MTDHSPRPPILNTPLQSPPWAAPHTQRLPGISPLEMADWIWVLDSYAGQMAERERRLNDRPERVLHQPQAELAAARELYDLVLDRLDQRADFHRQGDAMLCPDGRRVRLDRAAPLDTLGRLVQEDFCLLRKPNGESEHRLVAAVLCFPSNWTLAEKLGRPMAAIHAPVDAYDSNLARRVQRLLDGVQTGRPLWRVNRLNYDHAELFNPRSETGPQTRADTDSPFFRSERQCLVRLPHSGCVVFSIHTILLPRSAPGVPDEATHSDTGA